jgi:hypothetical protein
VYSQSDASQIDATMMSSSRIRQRNQANNIRNRSLNSSIEQ